MNQILPLWPLFGAFLAASFILAIEPGPGVFYIVTRSLAQGRRAGLASVAGIALGNLANAVGASVGLAALFVASEAAFVAVKYAGALYLVYLGIRMLRTPGAILQSTQPNNAPLFRIFRDAFTVALLNPKITIFFAAFLPQFMGGTAAPFAQSLALAATFVAIAAITDTAYALAGGALAAGLARVTGFRKFGRYLTGVAFIGLGALTAFAGPRRGT